MRLLYLNSFEQPQDNGSQEPARLSITEQEGIWAINWLKGESPAEIWYEGSSWEELLLSFRHGVAGRMSEGYVPLMSGLLHERQEVTRSRANLLHCYGELYANKEIYEQLRQWRRRQAQEQKRSAYLIASNRFLNMVAAYLPQTKEELLQLPGWGESKVEQYSEGVLSITKDMGRNTSFPLDWVADQLPSEAYASWLFRQKESKYKGDLDKVQLRKKIVEASENGETIEGLEQQLSISRRELLAHMEDLQQEGYGLESLINSGLSSISEEEIERASQAFDSKGMQYLKPVLLDVYGVEEEHPREVTATELYNRLRLIRLLQRQNLAKQAS